MTATTLHRTLAATALAAATVTGVAGAANAAPATPSSYVTVISAASVSGSTVYTPGLKANTPRATTAVFSSTIGGVSDAYGTNLAGNGSLNVTLSGTSSYGHVSETGSFVISWPAFYNPSTGSMTLSGPAADGSYTLAGSVTGGAFVGSYVSTKLFVTGINPGATGRMGHLLTKQTFVNTVPLTLARNSG